MTTITGRNASVYWASGLIAETRNVSIDLGADFIDDTVHGDTVRSKAPLFMNFNAKITGLYATGVAAATNSARIIAHALASTSSTFSIYIGGISQYFTGSGYVSVDTAGSPYDDFAPFDWSIVSLGTVTHYAM